MLLPALVLTILQTPSPAPPRKEVPMTLHAQGTFEVTVKPLSADESDWGAFARFSIDKQIHGDLQGTSRGQMLAEGGPAKGAGGYVALERVTGTLGGRKGSFALQHSGTMTKEGSEMTITVVPGSGTEELQGLAGRLRILIEGGKHRYEFDYTLPAR